MNDESKFLLSLVEQTVPVYAANPKVKAIAVTGSVATGQADSHSDTDTLIYYDELPTQEELTAARDQIIELLGGAPGTALYTDPELGYGEYYYINGAKCDFAHSLIGSWERALDEVLIQHSTDPYKQKPLAGIVDALPLYGHPLIEGWKARAARYPDELARKMVEAHLHFYPVWVPGKMAAGRDDLLWYYELLVYAEKNVMGVLLGLNRVYHPIEYKRMDAFIGQMRIAPPDLSNRLKHVLRAAPPEAIAELQGIIEEVLALVETYMPQIDLTEARRLFGFPYTGRA